MIFSLRHFVKDTSGAAAVDFVVLTAAIAGIGIAVLAATSSGLDNASNDVKRCLKIQGTS